MEVPTLNRSTYEQEPNTWVGFQKNGLCAAQIIRCVIHCTSLLLLGYQKATLDHGQSWIRMSFWTNWRCIEKLSCFSNLKMDPRKLWIVDIIALNIFSTSGIVWFVGRKQPTAPMLVLHYRHLYEWPCEHEYFFLSYRYFIAATSSVSAGMTHFSCPILSQVCCFARTSQYPCVGEQFVHSDFVASSFSTVWCLK